MLCFEGFCEDHFRLHSRKASDHNKFLIVHKELIEPSPQEQKGVKITKLEIPVQKAPEYRYNYSVEGEDLQLDQLTVQAIIVII